MTARLRSWAQALGGTVSGSGVICPGPGHSTRDRSLSVTLSAASPDGFVVYSHSGDDWSTCRNHVRARLGLPVFSPARPAGGHQRVAGHRQRRLNRLLTPARLRWLFGARAAIRAEHLSRPILDPGGLNCRMKPRTKRSASIRLVRSVLNDSRR